MNKKKGKGEERRKKVLFSFTKYKEVQLPALEIFYNRVFGIMSIKLIFSEYIRLHQTKYYLLDIEN